MPLNPQQLAFKEAYLNPESETFSNAYQSALKAGYSDEYAKNITGQDNDWLSEIIRELEMRLKAEKALNKTLDFIDHENPSMVKIGQDSAKFVSERIGRFKQKSEVDLTSKGEKIDAMSPAFAEAVKQFEETLKKSVIE